MKAQNKIELAREWIATDQQAVQDDIARLGLDGAAQYNYDLAVDAMESPDCRWIGITKEALYDAMGEIVQTLRQSAYTEGRQTCRETNGDLDARRAGWDKHIRAEPSGSRALAYADGFADGLLIDLGLAYKDVKKSEIARKAQ